MFTPESARSWAPFAIMMGVLAAMLTTFIFGKVWSLLKEKPKTPLVWERIDTKPPKKKARKKKGGPGPCARAGAAPAAEASDDPEEESLAAGVEIVAAEDLLAEDLD